MKTKLKVIKIGGAIIDDHQMFNSFLYEFSNLKVPKILIHGGGKIATRINEKLGIETVMNEGRRITTEESLETVTMVYAGLINKKIVSKLQALNCNALGLSGADGNSILTKKRSIKPIDFGWVGDVESVNITLIQLLLDNEIQPIFSAICHNGKGSLLNTNADTVAAEIAIAMSSVYDVELTYCFEKNGVLLNIADDNSVIEKLNHKTYQKLKSNDVINEGMIPKLNNSFYALSKSVSIVKVGGLNVFKENGIYTSIHNL
jgi:acetylglutamate kinase